MPEQDMIILALLGYVNDKDSFSNWRFSEGNNINNNLQVCQPMLGTY